jgi:hypothetical protein
MLFGFDLNQLLLFPVRDDESRKHFLVGSLLYLAGFMIPMIPWVIVAGYTALIIRQVLRGEKPHLVPWENWEELLKDGARLIGIRLIYASPLILMVILLILVSFAFGFLPLIFQDIEGQNSFAAFYFLLIPIMTLGGILIFPLSIALACIIPAAEIHMIAEDDFKTGFQFNQWWPIFKKNWAGFVVALAIVYMISVALSFAMQFLILSLVLICLLPFVLAPFSMYSTVIQYAAFAQAYKVGREKVSGEALAPIS